MAHSPPNLLYFRQFRYSADPLAFLSPVICVCPSRKKRRFTDIQKRQNCFIYSAASYLEKKPCSNVHSTCERKSFDGFKHFQYYIKFILKSSVFLDITSCSPLKVYWRFGGACRLHFQGPQQAKQETSMKQVESRAPLARLVLRPQRWKRHVLPKRQLTFQRTTWRYIT
jgi:hypothetical protein